MKCKWNKNENITVDFAFINFNTKIKCETETNWESSDILWEY